jgi:hypothetical protein
MQPTLASTPCAGPSSSDSAWNPSSEVYECDSTDSYGTFHNVPCCTVVQKVGMHLRLYPEHVSPSTVSYPSQSPLADVWAQHFMGYVPYVQLGPKIGFIQLSRTQPLADLLDKFPNIFMRECRDDGVLVGLVVVLVLTRLTFRLCTGIYPHPPHPFRMHMIAYI